MDLIEHGGSFEVFIGYNRPERFAAGPGVVPAHLFLPLVLDLVEKFRCQTGVSSLDVGEVRG